MELALTLESKEGQRPLSFSFSKVVNAGFTGKNQKEVQHHLEELAAKGISVPSSTPTLYPVVPQAMSTENAMEVFGKETSGELEYVLLVVNKDEIYVGLGSDHTDRNLEELHIPRSKQICPNILGKTVWPLKEIEAHWDDLQMSCTVTKDGENTLYQRGALGLLLNPAELIAFVEKQIREPLENIIIYSGTVKMETDDFVFADQFAAELRDGTLDRSLSFSYDIKPMDYMDCE